MRRLIKEVVKIIYIMTLVSLFAADTIIKHYIEKTGKTGEESKKFNGKVIIKKYHNKGAMFNMGDKRQHLIALISLVFTSFMTGIFVATLGLKGKKLLNMGLALMLGGAYSNTYDRLKRKYVVDYVSFNLFNKKNIFSSIVFNISDFGIIIGAMFLVISELMKKE